jgi:hypothetical protein
MPLCPLLFSIVVSKSHENVAAFDISLSDPLLKCRPLYSNQNCDGFTFLQFLMILLIDFIICFFFCFWFFFSFLGFCFKCLTSNLTINPPIIPLYLSLSLSLSLSRLINHQKLFPREPRVDDLKRVKSER